MSAEAIRRELVRAANPDKAAFYPKFFDRHAAKMPRTMLRYALERFSPERRQHYLRCR
jgi:hypothetical protein